jgi:cold shock CspA family protein/uncharacterized LabA/DUF88 family protein
MSQTTEKLSRIGIFYDGNFFFHVSNFYQYYHERRSRISIGGLHQFVRDEVAKVENSDVRYCQIVDAHYFRGRLRAADADDRDLLYKERVFDDVLVREGVTTHYIPMGREQEKGIDVWLALEAYEASMTRRFDVVVLVACDGDFLPLIRKIHSLGPRVMVLGWDLNYVDQNGNDRETRTAQSLLDEATYPVLMNQIIDDRSRRNDTLVSGLFVPRKDPAPIRPVMAAPVVSVPAGDGMSIPSATTGSSGPLTGEIQNLKNGFGFITPDQGGPNIFFFHLDVMDVDFLDLRIGERVQYQLGMNERGPCAKQVKVLA